MRDPPRFDHVERLFRQALERPVAERERWLADHADGELFDRVRRLLYAHEALEKESGPAADDDRFLDPIDAGAAQSLLRSLVDEGGDAPDDLEPGEHLGRYRIERVLGRGGAGIVYLGHDPELDRPVALKVLPPHEGAGDDPVLREARAASALDHPHVGTVYEVGDAGERGRFIAMAWYGGGTLRDRMAGRPLPRREALDIARQIADGLGAAHAAGLVHRDVKPENVVFDRQGRAKVVDFGLAGRSYDPGAGHGGTLPYMSPEQRRGEPLDARTDVWATGVLLHELLVGRRPDGGDGGGGELPKDLRPLLARCLDPDPGRRWASGGELSEELARAHAHGRRIRRRRRIAAAAVVLAVASVGAGAFMARGLPRVLEASGDAAGAFPQDGWVVVADFDVTDDLADIGVAAREALAVDLQQSSFVNVVSRAEVREVLGRMDVGPDVPLDLPRAMEVAERFGAGAVVGTTVARAGERYVLSGRAYDPATGAELFAVRTTADSTRLLGAVERLSREVRARLGEDAEALAGSLPLPEVTTSSLEALRLYAEAERAHAAGDPGARALVLAAIDLDPGFAMAYRLAAAEATNRIRWDEVRQHVVNAFEHRDRLPPRERGHVDAFYHLHVRVEPGPAVEAYEMLVRRDPEDARAWHNLGVILQSWMGRHREAYEAYARSVEVDPTLLTGFHNGTYAAYVVDEPDVADELAARGEAGGMPGFVARWQVARAFAQADVETAARGCAELLESRLPPPPGAGDEETCGSMDVAAGRLATGVPRLRAARDDAWTTGRARNAVQAAMGLSVAALLQGDPARAEDELTWVVDRIPADAFGEPDRFISRVHMTVQARLLGLHAAAERVQTAYPDPAAADHWHARMGLALEAAAGAVASGEGERALARLERDLRPGHLPIGWDIWVHLIRGLALAQSGDPGAALPDLAAASDPRYLTSPFATTRRPVFPLILRARIRAAEAAGDAGAADEARAHLAALGDWSAAELPHELRVF